MTISRRSLIKAAPGLLLPSRLRAQDIGFSPPISVGFITRGMGQGMRQYIAGTGPSSISSTYRSRHKSFIGFSRFRVVIPTFVISGTVDADYANNLNFQVGFEYPYVNANAGIPNRIPVTFGGVSSVSYLTASPPSTGYLLSDWITLPTPVPAGAFFGLWTTVEQPNAQTFVLPYNDYGSNFFEQYEGALLSGSLQIPSNTAILASSIAHLTTAQAGTNSRFTPCFLLIDYPVGAKMPMIFGDSIASGSGEDAAGSGAIGTNSTGDAFSNSGFAARGLFSSSYNYIKIAIPGDSYSNTSSTNAMKYRLQLMALANPSHAFIVMGTNDVAAGAVLSGIAANAINTVNKIRTAVPGIRIGQNCILPRTTTTDAWATSANQSDAGGFTGTRQQLANVTIRSLGWGNDYFYDPNVIAEAGYVPGSPPTDTNRWAFNGAANYATGDGIHPNSTMNAALAAGMTADSLS